jgi:hypothetical protein
MVVKQLGTSVVGAMVCAISFVGTAWACGDKLVALGGGVGFERIMVSRNPGHIVLMLEPATGLAAANDKFNLAASLSLAGHEVFIAKNEEELRTQRGTEAPDLILVDASRAKELQVQLDSGGAGPMIMPVAYPADSGAAMPVDLQAGCVTVADGRKGAQVLKAVEQALKLRSRGQPMPCETSANRQKT